MPADSESRSRILPKPEPPSGYDGKVSTDSVNTIPAQAGDRDAEDDAESVFD